MSKDFFKVKKGLNLDPTSSASIASPEVGDIIVDSSDNNKLKRYDDVTASWKDVGSGVGGINYISANSDFEGGTVGYARYANAAATEIPETGTGGSPNAAFTFTATTVSPLRGTKSGLITKDANSRLGHGVSYDFSIDPADQAQVLRISFDYNTEVSTTNYADGDIRVYVYDVTNSRLIEVIDRDLLASTQGKFVGTFQTSPDSLNYRLIFHIAGTGTTAWTVELDNVIVGPQTIVKGAIVTDPEVTTVTSLFEAATTPPTFGTLISDKLSYSRRGKYLVIQGSIGQSTAGTAGNGIYHVSLPNNLAADFNFIENAGNTGFGVVGSAQLNNSSFYTGSVAIRTTTPGQLRFMFGSDLLSTNLLASSFLPPTTAAWRLSFTAEIPILGWSSNVVLSEDAGNREIIARLYEQVDQSIVGTTFENMTFSSGSVLIDTAAMFSDSDDGFIISETGYYDVWSGVEYTANATGYRELNITVDDSEIKGSRQTVFNTTNNATSLNSSVAGVFFSKGDIIRAQTRQNSGGALLAINKMLGIAKRSSPQTIAASEVVAAHYTSNSGQSITTGGLGVPLIFEDLITDTHNAYNTLNGDYVIPQTGWYRASANFRMNQDLLATGTLLSIYGSLDGVNVMSHEEGARFIGVARYGRSMSGNFYATKGQIFKVYGFQNSGATKNLEASTGINFFSISKINGVS